MLAGKISGPFCVRPAGDAYAVFRGTERVFGPEAYEECAAWAELLIIFHEEGLTGMETYVQSAAEDSDGEA